ncbi:type II secretion system F family protein [Candidatus Woesearchaeota archaeon]|nr:type II secretion system F family protein [Candidatus Woesearchaeota archaeon]
MYRFLAGLYPPNLREKYSQLLVYADLKTEPRRFLGFILFFGFGLALGGALLLGRLIPMPLLLLFILLFVFFEAAAYFYLLLRADTKARIVEGVLPDALQLMSSNLRAGLTTDRALLLSARPEFGPLQHEINEVGKKITMGDDISTSLMLMTERIRSEHLRKTLLLIVVGLKSGGELASLLEQTAENLRQQRFVEEKIRSSVMMYVFFIFAAVAIGSPLLFGLSSFLVEVLKSNISSLSLPETSYSSSMPLSFSEVSLSSEFVMFFSIISLVTSSVMGSFILGLIGKGKETRGIRYIPILILISLGMFFLTRAGIRNMLGGLFGL